MKWSAGPGSPANISHARVVLNDFSSRTVELFANRSIMAGQELALTMDEPKRFYCRGRVLSCHEIVSESHIVSKEKFSWRVKLEFIFDSAEQQKSVADYCTELLTDMLGVLPKRKAA